MGWNGIIIKTFFNTTEESYLFKLKGLLSSEFILINTEKKELLVVECDFKWNKLDYDYTIETTQEFDNFTNKNLLVRHNIILIISFFKIFKIFKNQNLKKIFMYLRTYCFFQLVSFFETMCVSERLEK